MSIFLTMPVIGTAQKPPLKHMNLRRRDEIPRKLQITEAENETVIFNIINYKNANAQ